MLVGYGFGDIYVNGECYKVAPTFKNIEKLGDKKEILSKTVEFFNAGNFNDIILRSIEILDCCTDKPLPIEYVGEFVATKKGLKYKPGKIAGVNSINDMIAIAARCLRYGIIGVLDDESSGDGEPIKEFDVYYFIGLATEHLGRTREQAADMTLTEFLMAWDVKFPEQAKERKEKARKAKALNALMAYQKELDEKAAQKRAAKQS